MPKRVLKHIYKHRKKYGAGLTHLGAGLLGAQQVLEHQHTNEFEKNINRRLDRIDRALKK